MAVENGLNTSDVPQVISSGAYRSVCVQLRLYHLAVAAVERCEALAELEGAAAVGAAVWGVAIERYLTTYLLVDASIIAGRLGALRTVRITLPVLSR